MPEVDPQSLQSKPPEQASTGEPRGANDPRVASDATATSSRPPRRIFVCCDGTGNEFQSKDSLEGNSNVVKLYTALRLDGDHVAYYHPGVGTLGDPTKDGVARGWSMIKGLAFGYGFRDNVLDAYRYLMQHYASGDVVYIFGFSRGAYTARALAGLLHGYGLLCRGNEGHIPYAWRMYTERVASQKELNAHTIVTDTTFRDTFSHRSFSIYFVGLWDTVSSVGWVTTPVRLLDMAQNSTIQWGRHAVSIDERRCFYQDNLWGDPVAVDVPVVWRDAPEGKAMLKHQDQQQVWFSGVHSDIGGSYPQLQSGLSNLTLEWMIGEVRKADEAFDALQPQARRAKPVFEETRVAMVLGNLEKPTPETAELAPMYEKPHSSMLHPSLTGLWRLLEILPHRYYDKDDSVVRKRIPVGTYRSIPAGSLVHTSVKRRLLADPEYRPRNITAAELEEAPRTLGVQADGGHYLRFQPQQRRNHGIKGNGVVIFAVIVVELLAAFYLLYGLSLLGALAFPHLHPLRAAAAAFNDWFGLEHWMLSRWFKTEGRLAHFVWAVLVATLCVGVVRSIGWFKSRS